MQFILNSLSKLQGKASPSERRVLSSWFAGLHLLLKSPADCVTNSHAIVTCWILHWELVIWEMYREPGASVFGEVVKKGVPSRLILCVEYKSPESDWDARGEVASQRGNIQDNRCQPLQTQPRICDPRWPGEGSSPGAPIWALDALPGFFAHLTNFW